MSQAALITGASSGIGRALAFEFARNSHDLILVARSKEKLEALAERLNKGFNVRVEVIVADLSLADSADELFSEIASRKLEVSFLVNNAGIGDFGHFIDSDLAWQNKMIALNVTTLVSLTHMLLAQMRERGTGRVMNLASTAAFQPGPYMSVYYASKAFVLSFSEALAGELADTPITVTALCPGPTSSGFQQVAGMKKSGWATRLPMPSSEDVARLGYRAMMSGRKVAIYGAGNKLVSALVRMLPRNLTTSIVKKINQP